MSRQRGLLTFGGFIRRPSEILNPDSRSVTTDNNRRKRTKGRRLVEQMDTHLHVPCEFVTIAIHPSQGCFFSPSHT